MNSLITPRLVLFVSCLTLLVGAGTYQLYAQKCETLAGSEFTCADDETCNTTKSSYNDDCLTSNRNCCKPKKD